jgi:LysM domain
MPSSQCSVPTVAPAAASRRELRSEWTRPAPARPGGRSPLSAAPVTGRRDAVRPGARPGRTKGVPAARPVRGLCPPEGVVRSVGGPRRADRAAGGLPPLRLTQRGRRVVAGMSIAIGLSIAAVTVTVVQVSGGGLELAGASTFVVQPGDTLWSIALSTSPEEDPRGVVDAIVVLNDLEGVGLVPGQVLELP